MDYDLYHDESMENRYWHGMLLVPRSTRRYLLSLLEKVRKNLAFDGVLSYKSSNPKNHRRFRCGTSWIEIGAGALMQRKKEQRYPSYATATVTYDCESKRKVHDYKQFECLIRAKFILLRERDSHVNMSDIYFPDHTSKIETTFRMGLKGGLHFLGRDEQPINVSTLHFDGYKHHGRNIDKTRVIDRIFGLRSYCTFANNVLVDDRSSNHILPEKQRQHYDDCQLLQLTDLIIGSFRAWLSNRLDNRVKLAKPFLRLVDDWKKGRARMQNSRWFGGYCLSQCWLAEGEWNFGEIEASTRPSNQCEMF